MSRNKSKFFIHNLSKTAKLSPQRITGNHSLLFVHYAEFLGFKGITQASEDFISMANVIEINKAIIDACISIRKEHMIKLPDAIIAATALVYDLTIISRNTSDFKNITGLTVVDPHTL